MSMFKKSEKQKIKYKDREFKNFKHDLLIIKCLSYNRNYQTKFDEDLKKRFVNTNKF